MDRFTSLFLNMKHESIFKALMLVFLIFLVACKEEKPATTKAELPSQNEDFKFIAYYTPSTGEIEEETVDQLDQIIYSFLHLNGNKLAIDDADSKAALNYLTGLKEKNPDFEVLISLGGWGGCETCSEVFSTIEGRKEFAVSVKDLLEEYNADGIDLDWEYPVVEGYPGHLFQPQDRENFTALVAQLRETLGEDREISFAAGGFDDYLKRAVEWEKIMPLLDNVNLMSYDLVNGGSPKTGHHTSLYSTPEQPLSADKAINFLDSIGVPRQKIVLSAAFYARIWEEVDSISNGLYQTGKFKNSILYKDLEKFEEKNPGFKRYWDTIAKAPYSYNANKKMFATYDDSLSVAEKTQYVIEKNLGGIMFWQLSGDKKEEGLLDVIHRIKMR